MINVNPDIGRQLYILTRKSNMEKSLLSGLKLFDKLRNLYQHLHSFHIFFLLSIYENNIWLFRYRTD